MFTSNKVKVYRHGFGDSGWQWGFRKRQESRYVPRKFLVHCYLLWCLSAHLESDLFWHSLSLVGEYDWFTVTYSLLSGCFPCIKLLYIEIDVLKQVTDLFIQTQSETVALRMGHTEISKEFTLYNIALWRAVFSRNSNNFHTCGIWRKEKKHNYDQKVIKDILFLCFFLPNMTILHSTYIS